MIIKRVIAAGLLAVFLFITAVKLFHSHSASTFLADSSFTEQAELGSDCPVCDYHFTKDADYTSELIPAKQQPFHSSPIPSYLGRVVSSVGLSYSDRGPPSF